MRSRASSPFTVGNVPPGYAVVSVDRGAPYPPWGDDSMGSAEPFTVLAPGGSDASSADAIVVSVTGFEGYEGGLGQASRGGNPVVESERFMVEGRRAIFTPAQTAVDRRIIWADLVVVRGADLAVRVTARGASKARLLRILEGVEPARDNTHAPRVARPPVGYDVIGSVDAGVVARPFPDSDRLRDDPSWTGRGNPVVHRIEWTSPGAASTVPGNTLTVTTFPTRLAALDAIPGYVAFATYQESRTTRPVRIAGRPGVAVETKPRNNPGLTTRSVFTNAPWGNLIMVRAEGDTSIPSLDELRGIAASVARVDALTWRQHGA